MGIGATIAQGYGAVQDQVQCLSMAAANSIDEVIDALTGIIERAKTERSRLGYFPALYRRVTREVKRGIATGRFTDGPRMERMASAFANRYLAAYEGWRAGQYVSRCWMLAFGAAGRTDRTIIQHLLLGMNAHINLDLAIVSAEAAPGNAIHSLQADFQQINKILAEQINDAQDSIASVAPLMWLLDILGERNEERLVEFSLTKARDASWMQALVMAELEGEEKADAITVLDAGVNLIGAGVLDPPGFLVRTAVRLIVRAETPDVVRIIDALQ